MLSSPAVLAVATTSEFDRLLGDLVDAEDSQERIRLTRNFGSKCSDVKGFPVFVVWLIGMCPWPETVRELRAVLNSTHPTVAATLLATEPTVCDLLGAEDFVSPSAGKQADRDLVEDIFCLSKRYNHLNMLISLPGLQLLEKMEVANNYLMTHEGHLPKHIRNYLGIIAASSFDCEYLVEWQTYYFLQEGGDVKWLEGSDCASPKVRSILPINSLLAYQPWNLTVDLIRKVAESGRWTSGELCLAIVILCEFHALSSIALAFNLRSEFQFAQAVVLRAKENEGGSEEEKLDPEDGDQGTASRRTFNVEEAAGPATPKTPTKSAEAPDGGLPAPSEGPAGGGPPTPKTPTTDALLGTPDRGLRKLAPNTPSDVLSTPDILRRATPTDPLSTPDMLRRKSAESDEQTRTLIELLKKREGVSSAGGDGTPSKTRTPSKSKESEKTRTPSKSKESPPMVQVKRRNKHPTPPENAMPLPPPDDEKQAGPDDEEEKLDDRGLGLPAPDTPSAAVPVSTGVTRPAGRRRRLTDPDSDASSDGPAGPGRMYRGDSSFLDNTLKHSSLPARLFDESSLGPNGGKSAKDQKTTMINNFAPLLVPLSPVSKSTKFEKYHKSTQPCHYVDFNCRSDPIRKVLYFNWANHGLPLLSKYCSADYARLLDAEMTAIHTGTNRSINGIQNVDTEPFRHAIWHYSQRLYGVIDDAYELNSEVNTYLCPNAQKLTFKKFLKVLCVSPNEFARSMKPDKTMTERAGISFPADEMVHIALLATESKKEAVLLHGLNAVSQYIKQV